MVAGYIEYEPMLARNHYCFLPIRYLWALVDLVKNNIFANNRMWRIFCTLAMQSLHFTFSQ